MVSEAQGGGDCCVGPVAEEEGDGIGVRQGWMVMAVVLVVGLWSGCGSWGGGGSVILDYDFTMDFTMDAQLRHRVHNTLPSSRCSTKCTLPRPSHFHRVSTQS